MRALLVGAGAVGQVYGHHLQKGGAEVTFLVKPKYAEEARAGYTLYPLRRRDRRDPVRFEGFGVLTDAEQIEAGAFDQIWLCVSSPALRGPWLNEVARRLGDGTLVALQPGLRDRGYLQERFPDSHLVVGMIGLISYQAPLATEAEPPGGPGVAYWFPPASPTPFAGPTDRVRAVADALRAGGCPAVVRDDVPRTAAFGSSILIPVIAALETVGWSLARLRAEAMGPTSAACREALAVAGAFYGSAPPLSLRLLAGPTLLRMLIALAPGRVPFDLETYLRYHFTKVGDQTRQMLDAWITEGEHRALPLGALRELRSALG